MKRFRLSRFTMDSSFGESDRIIFNVLLCLSILREIFALTVLHFQTDVPYEPLIFFVFDIFYSFFCLGCLFMGYIDFAIPIFFLSIVGAVLEGKGTLTPEYQRFDSSICLVLLLLILHYQILSNIEYNKSSMTIEQGSDSFEPR